ncbi:MAG: hypothetical protein Q7R32_03660 [Dehalococcoidia bacterium]|jgi:hypothetical protein|nr:hypothetical protein [Dehalococcoidia bacterium]
MLDVFFDKWWRVGGIAGILYLVLFIAGIVVQGEVPAFDKPVDEIRDWFTDNGEQYLVGDYMVGLAFMLFFLPFLASLRGLLAAAEGGPAVWSRVAFAGGLLFLIFGATASVFWGALAYGFGVVENGDEGTIRTLMYLNSYGFTLLALALAPLLLASSLVIFRSGVLWRWLVVPGLLAGVLGIIGGASSLDSDPEGALGGLGFLAILLAALWILLVSINMILKREAPAPA